MRAQGEAKSAELIGEALRQNKGFLELRRLEAAREIARLRSLPRASDYLAASALAWQRAHPGDPKSPELLGQAFRVLRNACQYTTYTGCI